MTQDYKKYFQNKVVMITGGTGSFGDAVAERLLSYEPREVVIFSRDEKKQFDMANKFTDPRLRFILGDVRDQERVNHIVKGMDLIFHAAALKQAPNCEFFPVEAILTNSLGTHNIISAAVHHNIERVVVLSTDKAVYPVNVMGMTKALMERIMIAESRERRASQTILCGTRYGNVLYTRASVVPFFINLMKKGKPLTITNRNMTRYMMTLEDSIDLVFYALTNGSNGDIYVRKSPVATVGDLVEALVSLFGYTGGTKEIGARPGEKLNESLVSVEEAPRTEDCGYYYKIRPEVPDMDLKKYYFSGDGKTSILPPEGYTSLNAERLTVAEIKKLLLSLKEVQEELKNFKK